MSKQTYGRMLITEFNKLIEEYNYITFINDLEQERLGLLKISSEEEIKTKKLYKEHHLVRFIKKTILEMKEVNELATNSNKPGICLIDTNSIGNSMRFKNDLFTLKVFISKMEEKGYKKQLKAS